ncbi:uncharacterized protein LOC144659523 [Oculina patagonica]
MFQAALIINGQIDKSNKAMTAVKHGRQGGDFSLVVSGFMDLRSSDYISVYAYSEKDTDWVIEDDSQFSLRYSGSVGSFPAFSAIKHNAVTFSSFSSSNIIRNWKTSGSLGLFASLAGFSSSTGEFVPICDGIYFVSANIRVEARPGLYQLYISVNGKVIGPSFDERVVSSDNIFTMNLHGSLYFKTGDTVALYVNSSSLNARLTIHAHSGFSVSYIDTFNQSSLQGVSAVTQTTNEIPGIGWMEITTWSTTSIAHVHFYNPEVFQNGRFKCSQGGIYYISVSLRVRGRRGNFDLLVKSSGTSQLNGNAGLYTTRYNSDPAGYFSLSVSGLLELSKGQHVSVFVHSSVPDKWFIEPGSELSVMKTRHHWPAANSYLDSENKLLGGKWEEIGNWRQTGEGAFSFGTNFRSSSSRFVITSPGVYFVSTNLILCTNGTQISAVIAINGEAKEENGLFATHAYSPTTLTLNIAGSLNLEQGQNVSVYVRSESNDTWEVLEKSGFSAVFIGKSFAVPSVLAFKGSQTAIRTTNWVEIDEWQNPGVKEKITFQNGGGFDSGRGIFVAPVSGIYFASCMLVTRDVDVDNSGSYFEAYIGVNGQASLTNGLQNTRYIHGTNPPSGNDVMTITISGMVQLRRGDYAVIRARTSMDFDWKVESTSSFSMFLVSPSDIPYGNVGFLSRKSDTRIKSLGPGSWSKIGGWATQSDLTNGLFLKNDGSFTYEALSGDLNINHAGIYFLSANIIVSNTPESCEVTIRVSDSNGQNTQELVTGFSVTEQKPKSIGKYTLLFTGALFLDRNRRIYVAVRSGSANPFTVWEGSGFSLARLIYPIEEPGFYGRISDLQINTQPSTWEKITAWETSGGSVLHIDGHGFRSLAGNFIVPLSGIYLASTSVEIENIQTSAIVRVKISVNGDTSANNGLESSHFARKGANAAVVVSGSMKLSQGMMVNVIVRSENSSSLQITQGSYFTMRYMSESGKTEGNMADRYSDITFTTSGWKELVSWKTAGMNGQFQVGSIHQTTDRFGVSKSGIYFVTAKIQLLETNGLVIIGIVTNSGNDTAVVAKKTCVASEVCPLNLASSLELKAGTFVSVHVYSDDEDRWTVSSQSSKSNLYLNPVPPSTVVQGFLARVSWNVSVNGRQLSDWFRVRNWNITDRPGYFKTINGFSNNGAFVVSRTGVYIVTVNLILQCTDIIACDFELLVAFNGRLSSSSGLYARQTVRSLSVDTLNIMTVVQLFKWDTLTVALRSNTSYEILEDSTFSVVMHASTGGPFLCSNRGPTLIQELSPSYLRTRVGSSVTWSCEAVGETLPQYRWSKDFEVLPNVSSNSLAVTNGTVQDSGDYACVAEVSPVSVSSNMARLIVYDPRPSFRSFNYTVSVNENGPALQLILNIPVRAESKDKTHADMTFKIISGNVNDSFLLLPNTSSSHFGIYTARPLDREQISKYQLLVKVTNLDEHAPDSTTAVRIVVVDLNDNAPRFNKKIYDVSILENATIGHVVLVLHAQDVDIGLNANVSYTILAGSGMNTFNLNKTSGKITVMKLLDRETQPTYSLFIAARDPHFTAFTEVVITVLDVNEHKPVFNPLKYNVTISEAAGIGSSVLKLSATDKDTGTNSQLVYSIVNGDPRGLFAVDNGGVITVAKDLDHENNLTHNITIAVHDKGEIQLFADTPARVFISVRDLNDNSPIFEVSLYEETISERTPTGTPVLRVRAMDADRSRDNSKMVFMMVTEEPLEHDFMVNSSSGIIYVYKSLDFERTQVYRFQVAVRDFSMDSRLDVTTVVIKISDENDNSPVFNPTDYNISISEATAVGSVLLRIHAKDRDSTSNGALNYCIESGNDNSTFFLDESTGFLYLSSELDHENVSRYRLIISVTDKGVPPRKAEVSATVVIAIADENDNLPQFDSETYTVAVYENITAGTYVCSVHAEDRDSHLNQELMYVMAAYSDTKAQDKFHVNSTTGAIFTKDELDREEQKFYEFTVIARDGGKVPHEGFAKVIVTLIDVNDNHPVFEPAKYQSSLQLTADASITSAVITLTADDPDTGLGGKVSYTVLNITGFISPEDSEAFHCINESYGTFKIDEHTGTLRVARSLAARCVYTVTIRAMDHGSPPQFSIISVEIKTGSRNATVLGTPTTIAIVSQEDITKVIVIICVFVLIIAVIIALVIWREARRYMRKRRAKLARYSVRKDDDMFSSDEYARFRRYSIEHPGTYLDHCSTTTEMPSSLQTPRSDVETDILESFTLPYDGKEGYTVLDRDTESFCVSIDFGTESEEPFVFPVTMAAANNIDRKVARKKKTHARRKEPRVFRSSSESKRSQVSLPAKFGSRNHSKGGSVREVISDTRL